MTANEEELELLLQKAMDGDQEAPEQLFSGYRQQLKRMVRLRLNRQLQGRVDDSDVIQDAFLEAIKRLPEYVENRPLPFFLWLRHIAGRKLIDVHRKHLGAEMRDAAQEVSLYRGPLPAADSVSLAAQLLGQLTSPSQAAIKAETRIKLQEVLNSMDSLDREIIALRHFEQLNNREVAQFLELNESMASSRYLRALKKLKQEISRMPGLLNGG